MFNMEAKPLSNKENRPPMSGQVVQRHMTTGQMLVNGGPEHSILLLKGGVFNHHDALLLGTFGKIMEKPTDGTNLIRYVLLGLRCASFSLHWGLTSSLNPRKSSDKIAMIFDSCNWVSGKMKQETLKYTMYPFYTTTG